MTLELNILNWLSANYEPDEIRETSGRLHISLSGRVATHVENAWSKSIQNDVFVSAYPLAMWFAASWWRLRWESAPRDAEVRNVEWRMAHEMAAAGHGFIWPRLTFESDGERVDVICRQSEPTPVEPIRYIENFRGSVTALEFEESIDRFLDFVLARLDAVGIQNTDLQNVWNEVLEERRDADSSAYRQLEARLGYDPDEISTDIVNNFLRLQTKVGSESIGEIAANFSGDYQEGALDRVIELARSTGVEGRIQPPNDLHQVLSEPDFRHSKPWEQGWKLAQWARTTWGLDEDKISDKILTDILELDQSVFHNTAKMHQPMGLVVRHDDSDQLKFHFRRSNRPGRRFESARFLADYLIAPSTDLWLPATDAKTARQKVQRAFAAEFLCPIAKLKEYLNGDFSENAIEEAGEFFEVSPVAIDNHLKNTEYASLA